MSMALIKTTLIRSGQLQLPFAQILYPIAQLGCLFEFEPLRMLAHVTLELRDRLVYLLRRVFFILLQIQGYFEIISLVSRDQRSLDWFDDCLWRNALFLVVGFLQCSPASRFIKRP